MWIPIPWFSLTLEINNLEVHKCVKVPEFIIISLDIFMALLGMISLGVKASW